MSRANRPAAPQPITSLLDHAHAAAHAYVASAAPDHRRRFGQYFTPPRLAAWMADWVIQPDTRSVFDPAVGTGTLLAAAIDHPDLHPAATLVGSDCDPEIVSICQRTFVDQRRVAITPSDFLAADHHACRYDAIVCNPPYLRHRVLADRGRTYAAFEQRYGLKLSAFSNSYVLFILKIAELLSPHGRAAIITPIDYLQANFGVPIRANLIRSNLIDGLVLFDHSRLIFEDANIAACVLLLRADRATDEPIAFAQLADETQLVPLDALPPSACVRHRPDQIDPAAKWSQYAPRQAAVAPAFAKQRMVALGTIASVRRGIATGANDFFTLSAADVVHHAIPLAALRLCVAKATYAPDLLLTAADMDRLGAAGKKCYLLDVRGDPPPPVRRYLAWGAQRGLDRRFLPRQRTPWYAAEQRPIAPLWITTFSRSGFRVVLNTAGVANLTAFHGIYPHREPDATVLAAFLDSSLGQRAIEHQQRMYGSGLAKLEPGDVGAIHVPDPLEIPAELRHTIHTLFTQRMAAQRTEQVRAGMLRQEIDQVWLRYFENSEADRSGQP